MLLNENYLNKSLIIPLFTEITEFNYDKDLVKF